MDIRLYQIDTFTTQLFNGNPAAVCPLQNWLPDSVMQAIANENNLSETAFFVRTATGYHIRWFTPLCEVKLCGHATLASAHVIFNELGDTRESIRFDSLGGTLSVARRGNRLEMDFPVQLPIPCTTPQAILDAFGVEPFDCLAAEDYVVVFNSEKVVANAAPDMHCLMQLPLRGVAITAASDHPDFVCRFFAPRFGINEDPVTGSAFTQLIPYWANRLNKTHLHARQISARGGDVDCELLGDRVMIGGQAITYLRGEFTV